jgi:hypothetical protein
MDQSSKYNLLNLARGEKRDSMYSQIFWEYNGSTWEYNGSTWEYNGSTWEYNGVRGSTMGVQWEYSGSTVGVQWEYSGSTMGVWEYGSLAFSPLTKNIYVFVNNEL